MRVVVAFVFAGCDATTLAPSITPVELQARQDAGTAPLVVDVRNAAEFDAKHIPETVNIPFDEIADRIGELDTPNGVALYCMVGPRARHGEAALRAVGYKAVLHVEGGLSAWQAAKLPVEHGH